MSEVRTSVRSTVSDTRYHETEEQIQKAEESLRKEGFEITYGKIGSRTTYALLFNRAEDREIVGYTFVKDMKYYRENVGKLKALQQAIARKRVAEEEND